MTSPIPDVTNSTLISQNFNDSMLNFWLQLASISYATQTLFLGSAVEEETTLIDNRKVPSQPSFLDIKVGNGVDGTEFSWGDVSKGIEEMSHNVTAAILALSLGTMSSTCSFDQQVVVYRYNPVALWVPYGVSNFSLLLLPSYESQPFPHYVLLDSLGHRSNFARCCRHHNDDK